MNNYTLTPRAIVYEDNHLLIINKPAGWLSQGDMTGDPSVVDICKSYIKERYEKPGNVYLGLPHRLDRPVSGLIICCKTSKSLERMNRLIKQRDIEKIYHALCLNAPSSEKGRLVSFLRKDRSRNIVSHFDKPVKGAQEAILDYSYLGKQRTGAHLMELKLHTGRPHQIRVQLNAMSCPIMGDLKYFDKQAPLPDKSIALHARRLSFKHPVGQEPVECIADYPAHAWWQL